MSRVDRSRLPALEADPAVPLPLIRTDVLPNGLSVRTVRHGQMPVVTFQLVVPVGSSADPADRFGLAALTGDMLDEGAGLRSMVELHEALARTGSQFDLEVSADGAIIGLTTLTRHVERALALLADIVVRPRLEAGEFDRVREQRLTRLRQLRDVAGAVADRAFAESLYGSHPYGHGTLGTEESLRRVTRDEVAAFHAAEWRPAAATLIAAGDLEHEAIAAMASSLFGGWDHGPAHPARPLPEPAAGMARTVLVHRPAAPQSEIRVGRVGAARKTPHFHALLVLNMILGGQFVSRINLNLREDKGLTYGARSGFDFRRSRGPFVVSASVQTDATAVSVAEVQREVRDLVGARPPSDAEIEGAKAALTRGYPRGFETAAQVARGLAQLAAYDMPDDALSEYVPRIRAVDRAALEAAASAHLTADDFLVVVVGDRAQAEAQFGRSLDEVQAFV